MAEVEDNPGKNRIRTGGAICCAINCTNAFYKKDCKGLPLFGFPKDKERCRVWIQNVGREDLQRKPIEKIIKGGYKLCGIHFKSSQYTVPSERKRLNWNAVPTLFDVPGSPPTFTHQRKCKSRSTEKRMKMNCDHEKPIKFKPKMEADKKVKKKDKKEQAFPKMLLVNAAFLHAKTLGSCQTKTTFVIQSNKTKSKMKQSNNNQSREFRFSNSNIRMTTVKCNSDSVLSKPSQETGVGVQTDREEEEYCLVNDSSQIKCDREIEVDSDIPLAKNGCVIKQENKCDSDSFEYSVFYPMEMDKLHNQGSFPDCCKIKQERIEENTSLKSSGHTTIADGNLDIHFEMSTGSCSSKQENLQQNHEVVYGSRGDETINGVEHYSKTWDTSTSTVSDDEGTNNDGNSDMVPYITLEPGGDSDECDNVASVDDGWNQQNVVNQCSVCKETFDYSGQLKTHMRTHAEEYPYKCSLCNKAYRYGSDFTRHVRIHTGEKSFWCSICEKAFTTNFNLMLHMRTHTGEKNYKCAICDKAFITNAHLIIHMRSHTGEKPYKCTLCEKAFSQKSALTLHLRTHTGEKPFKCFVCDKSFGQNSYLTTHMRKHSGEKPFKCTVCDMSFRYCSHRTRHMKKKHKRKIL